MPGIRKIAQIIRTICSDRWAAMHYPVKTYFDDHIRHKKYSGKINLREQAGVQYGMHRSGWGYAMRSIRDLHNPRGVYLDAFIERSFTWYPKQKKRPHLEPWVGFLHVPPHIPEWFDQRQSNRAIFEHELWKLSLPYCRGLYTLSAYHRRYLEPKLNIPVNNLIHPTETPELKWTPENYRRTPEKTIVQVGWWLRRLYSIYLLPVKRAAKIFLRKEDGDMDAMMKAELAHMENREQVTEEVLRSVRTVRYLSNENYDRLLAESIVFLDLYDSSANNAIVECIVRGTPVLVNPIGPIVEQLGPDYPFYFATLEEAAAKAEDEGLIVKTHEYLLELPLREKLSGDYFRKSLMESEIYRGLEHPGIVSV